MDQLIVKIEDEINVTVFDQPLLANIEDNIIVSPVDDLNVTIEDEVFNVQVCGFASPNNKVAADINDPVNDYLDGKVDGVTLDVDTVLHKMEIHQDIIDIIIANIANEYKHEYVPGDFGFDGNDYYIDVEHDLDTEQIIMSVEKEKSAGVWSGTNPGKYGKVDEPTKNNVRRLYFASNPSVNYRVYFIGVKP